MAPPLHLLQRPLLLSPLPCLLDPQHLLCTSLLWPPLDVSLSTPSRGHLSLLRLHRIDFHIASPFPTTHLFPPSLSPLFSDQIATAFTPFPPPPQGYSLPSPHASVCMLSPGHAFVPTHCMRCCTFPETTDGHRHDIQIRDVPDYCGNWFCHTGVQCRGPLGPCSIFCHSFASQ